MTFIGVFAGGPRGARVGKMKAVTAAVTVPRLAAIVTYFSETLGIGWAGVLGLDSMQLKKVTLTPDLCGSNMFKFVWPKDIGTLHLP